MTHRTADEQTKTRSHPQSPPPSYAGYPPQSPQPYQTQPYYPPQSHQQSYEMPSQQQQKSYHGQAGYEQQPQVVYVQTPPSKVVVQDKRHTKDDVALGFCAGCATACCCCGCTVM